MSLVSGTMGAVMGSDATTEAANAAAMGQMYTAKSAEQAQKDLMEPYRQVGMPGLAALYGQDITYKNAKGEDVTIKGSGAPYDLFTDPVTGQKISYDDMVTRQIKAYEGSPEYKALNALAQKNLALQRQARGLEYAAPASAAAQSAELSQKLTASDYANYKADLVNRYNALRGQAASQYDFLTQQANLGLGATSQLGSAAQTSAQQAAAAFGTQAQGGAQAGRFWSGLGGASANTLSTGLKAYDAVKGWFDSPASSLAGAGTPGGIDASQTFLPAGEVGPTLGWT